LGLAALDGTPPRKSRRARLSTSDAASAWFATPVQLSARLDHVRLVDLLLRVVTEDQAAWCADFAITSDPIASSTRTHAASFSAGSRCKLRPRTPRLLDADVAPASTGQGFARIARRDRNRNVAARGGAERAGERARVPRI
jgi:hypothetical protein